MESMSAMRSPNGNGHDKGISVPRQREEGRRNRTSGLRPFPILKYVQDSQHVLEDNAGRGF